MKRRKLVENLANIEYGLWLGRALFLLDSNRARQESGGTPNTARRPGYNMNEAPLIFGFQSRAAQFNNPLVINAMLLAHRYI